MTEVAADLIVHAAGRVPEIDDLRLDVAGIERQYAPCQARRELATCAPGPAELDELGGRIDDGDDESVFCHNRRRTRLAGFQMLLGLITIH